MAGDSELPDGIRQALREKYGYEAGARELLLLAGRLPELGSSNAGKARFIDCVERLEDESLAEISECLAEHMGRIDESSLLEIWQRWIESDSVLLHILMPMILVATPQSSSVLASWLLEQGVHYPNPSFNRYFVQAAVRKLGLCNVLGSMLEMAGELDREDLERLASAYRWADYDASDLSGDCPDDHDRKEERILRRRIQRRLKRRGRRRWVWFPY